MLAVQTSPEIDTFSQPDATTEKRALGDRQTHDAGRLPEGLFL